MTAMCDYLEKKLLDHTLGITAFTKPTTDYTSLHTVDPTDTGSHTNEVSVTSTGYARQSITSSMNATNATSGLSDNATAITHGPATADWGTITHIGIEDATTSGNMLLHGAATASRTIQVGDSYQLAAGQLAITFA
jgi:hypothetical protein